MIGQRLTPTGLASRHFSLFANALTTPIGRLSVHNNGFSQQLEWVLCRKTQKTVMTNSPEDLH